MLQELNPEQLAAAQHGDGPLLIVAGAGTGKTATLVHRVAYLIERGADPRRILVLTFTRRASAEMLRRVESVLAERTSGPPGDGAARGGASDRVWGGTFHAIAARLLRIHARDIGMEPDFTIVDRGDAEDLMHVARTALGLGRGGDRFPQKSTCLDVYSRCVNAQLPLNEVLHTAFPWCLPAEEGLAQLLRPLHGRQGGAAGAGLRRPSALLAGPARRPRLGAAPACASASTTCWSTSSRTPTLCRPTSSACFGRTAPVSPASATTPRPSTGSAPPRCATSSTSSSAFPAPSRTLTRNYRSTDAILAATNAVIAEAAERRDKELWTERKDGGRPLLATCRDEDEQTQWLCERILEHREQGTELKKQAVLFRAQHHSMSLEMELSRRNVPFHKYGGLRFVEMAHVKDLVSFLRLAENPRDAMAGLSACSASCRASGPKTAAALAEALGAAGGLPGGMGGRPRARARPAGVAGRRRDLRHPHGHRPPEVPAQVHAVRSVYGPLLERRYDNVQARLRDLEQIEALAARSRTRSEFLAELVLDPPSYTQELAGPPLLDEDYLILSTMHSAKGLEFDVVYVIHAADGNIPSDMATGSVAEIEEERRLFYVACTRAREQLYVTHPLRYYTQPWAKADTHGYAQRSRFLTPAVLAHFEQVQTGPEQAAGDEGPLGRVTTASIRAGVRSLWEAPAEA